MPSLAIGFAGVVVAAVGFATNFMVIKKDAWTPGDGMFFQLNMVLGVWMTGMIYYIAVGAPPFQPFAMVGGALWATGNALCPFVIENIGMGMGLLIWGTANMMVGWASSHFGILLIQKQLVSNPTLNEIGAVVAVCSIIIYSQVKGMDAEEKRQRMMKKKMKKYAAKSINNEVEDGYIESTSLVDGKSANAEPKKKQRVVAMAAALIAGLLFGSCFNPPQHLVDISNDKYCSKINYTSPTNTTLRPMEELHCKSIARYCDEANAHIHKYLPNTTALDCQALADSRGQMYCYWDNEKESCGGIQLQDMVFSQFTGMLVAAMFWLSIYIIYIQGIKGKEIFVNRPLIGPGFVCGAIWAIAQIGWFYANDNLPQSVSFPVVATAPGLIATVIGIVVYDEVSLKTKNLALLGSAFVIAAVGDALITISR